MPDQNRLCPLQVRVSWNRCITSLLRAIHEDAAQLRQFFPQLIDRRPDVQPQIGRNLFIAAAPAVQLVPDFADQRDKLLLDEMMNVFRLIIFEKCS